MKRATGVEANLRRLEGGQKLVDAPTGEKLVISGLSGLFPNSDNVQYFIENLLKKVDLCDESESRWKHFRDDIPKKSGKINNIDKFDYGYFGISKLQANWMDPLCRLLVERTVEAILDAGINPEELKGTNTGVFVGACLSESEVFNMYCKPRKHTYPITGCTRSMLSQRISYALHLNGPSFICDTACSSSLTAFEMAYCAIRDGMCDKAIVAATQLCLHPGVTLQFTKLGALNMNTGCRPFDRDAKGYTRSEAIVAIVLQKETCARRIYAKIIHSKINSDGFKEKGITYPSSDDQLRLLKDVYEECRIDPSSLAYIEAHGTGTIAGDPEEVSAIDKLSPKTSDNPLLIGSVKGNTGHAEPASGLVSVAKVILGMNLDCIAPNIHYNNPRPDIPALMEKRLMVVTDTTEWPKFSKLAGVNNFGFGGSNCHVLLEKFDKRKEIKYDGIPRLVCFSGRTREAVETIQDYLKTNNLDYEFIRLIQEIFSKDMPSHKHRGYSILLPNEEIRRSICSTNNDKKILYLCLGVNDSNGWSMFKELQKLPLFKQSYDRCLAILNDNGTKIQFLTEEPSNILQKILITVIIQIGLIDIFKTLNITFNYVRGYSMGSYTAAYAKGVLTLEEIISLSCIITKYIYIDLLKSDNQTIQSEINPKKMAINEMQEYKFDFDENFLVNLLNTNLTAGSYPPFENNAVIVNVDVDCFINDSMLDVEELRTGSTVTQIFNCIGRLYELGHTPCVYKLFPKIEWPVSQGTSPLSPLIKWNHSSPCYIKRCEQISLQKVNETVIKLDFNRNELSFYKGHVIDERILFPATGYLVLVWNFFSDLHHLSHGTTSVCFENVKFLRGTVFSKEGITFIVTINEEGYFEISERNIPVATGKIYTTEIMDEIAKPEKEIDEDDIAMSQKDIYKELRLRGYQYRGDFKAIDQMFGNKGLINWGNNWITFLDNMMQLYVVKEDTRSLLVPTGIDRIYIDPQNFLRSVTPQSDKLVACYTNKSTTSIQTKHVHIYGLRASAISRRRQTYQPVLESYKFVPNFLQTNICDSIRINMQIILENKNVIKIKILEYVNDDHPGTFQILSPEIIKFFDCMPTYEPEIAIFSKHDLNIDMKGIVSIKDKLTHDHNYLIYIGSHILQNKTVMLFAISAIEDDGFIITIEDKECTSNIPGLNILTTHVINNKFVYLLNKRKQLEKSVFINVGNLDNINIWLNSLKECYKHSQKTFLYAQNNVNGILGLTNCIRKEPNGSKVSCFLIKGKSHGFDENDIFYKKQIEKNMSVNVYQDGQWGTYRHLLNNSNAKVNAKHFFGSTGMRGDLASMDWYQGNLSSKGDICQVYYSSLNFRDVMLATGKIPVELITKNRIEQECVEGFEFSGRDKDGNRVMGIAQHGSNSNLVECKSIWKVPSYWSLEDAATIPVVYLTVLKAFHEVNLKPGQSILIHSGTGGIGQAALNVCEYYKCNVFTTVGTNKKKEYIIKQFPYIIPSHIGNSRDTTFEEMIFRETNGCGVDIILNSLSEDKLHASVRCLAKGGYFLEIGKFDLFNNVMASADLLSKACTYQGIMVDGCFNKNLFDFFGALLKKSYIKPLNRTVFQTDQLENAYRYMAAGKHMGKVLIKIRDEEIEKVICPPEITYSVIPKFYCDPNLSYIILGGLGGFGLELADWLMLKGAKVLILSSRNGVVNGYQQNRIRIWKNNGIKIFIYKDDITTYGGCKNLITKANNVAPIGGIFNLAVELRDGLFEDLTYTDFQASLNPKAYATIYLDSLSQEFCPCLHQFVVFSSISCGRGNAGQTNYGMSNSIMERICEQRKARGLPALAIQWGAVGDVGLVAEMRKEASEIVIGGTLQQRISSCLNVLEKFLMQNEVVVSSMVVAEKFIKSNTDNIVDTVLALVGVSDIKNISMHSTLPELGMDSMMAIEIKQTLEREYDVFLSSNEIRSLTFARLVDIRESMESMDNSSEEANALNKIARVYKFDETNFDKLTVEISTNKDTSKKILLFPGIEGTYINLVTTMNKLKYFVACLQYAVHGIQENFEDVINFYYSVTKNKIAKDKPFNIIGYSFGGGLALEIVSKLEMEGYSGKLVLIDSSPEYIHKIITLFSNNYDETYEVKLILKFLENYVSEQELHKHAEALFAAKTIDERKQIAINMIPDDSSTLKKYLYDSGENVLKIIRAYINHKFWPKQKLRTKVMLCKPTHTSVKEIVEDYQLSEYVENIQIKTFNGDHLSILENNEMINEINIFFND